MLLTHYKKFTWTSDTIEAIKKLELIKKAKIEISGVAQSSYSDHNVAQRTGREVYLSGDLKQVWSVAIPLGFTPLDRYPIQSETSNIFHFYGPWHPLMDRLMGMGRGDAVWDSFICAGQIEVGTWQGDRISERTLQTHLHRLGYNPGPIDGIIGPRTLKAIVNSGLEGSLSSMVEKVVLQNPISTPSKTKGRLQASFDFSPPTIITFGDVFCTRQDKGFFLDVKGSGRAIIDFS